MPCLNWILFLPPRLSEDLIDLLWPRLLMPWAYYVSWRILILVYTSQTQNLWTIYTTARNSKFSLVFIS